MKSLVVFYSHDGSTKAVAGKIAAELKCPVEEIIGLKKRSGPIGWLTGGRDAMKAVPTEIKALESNFAEFDLVVIGTPIWADNVTPAVRALIEKNKNSLKSVAFFCTAGGGKGGKAFAEMESIAGKKPKATLELSAMEVKKWEVAPKINRFAEEITRAWAV
ncbi:MAG: NAD(P)H-dependent oxidoreductase [Candidatus Diapherotrites archaeon]